MEDFALVHKTYLTTLEQLAENTEPGLSDEQVWLAALTSTTSFPNEIWQEMVRDRCTVFDYADGALKEFKARFRSA